LSDNHWESELTELKQRQALAKLMGGDAKVKRQHDAGRMTVRERITALLDPESFHEIGELSGFSNYSVDGKLDKIQPANVLIGRGRINSRTVVINADDFTVRGGAADASIFQKQLAAEQMARELRLPLIRLIEGTGGGGSVKSLEDMGYTYVPFLPGWDHVIANLNTVPVVSLGLGPVAGLGAARLTTSHYSLLVRNTSQMFVAGPPVVAAAGEQTTKEELGGAEIHAKVGAISDIADTEFDAFERCRQFLSYLPDSVYQLASRITPTDPTDRRDDWLISAIPKDRRQLYKMHPIIETIVDQDSFFEMGHKNGPSVITGFARMDGWPVALIANDPYQQGGLWTAAAAAKIERFVDLAQTFHLPVIHLVDNPGFNIGKQAERDGTIHAGARALSAIYQATVPWCTVLIRKAFGVAGAAQSNHSRFQYRFAWPSGDWGSLPIEGGIEAAYKSELLQAENPQQHLEQIKNRLNQVRSPFRTAEHFGIEEIIDPRDTRKMLCEFANLAAPLRQASVQPQTLRPF